MNIYLKILVLYLGFALLPSLAWPQAENMGHNAHHGHSMENHKKFDELMKLILGEYLKIHSSLVSGEIGNMKDMSEQIIKLAKKLDPESVSGEHAGHYKHVPMNLEKHAKILANASDLKSAREAFMKLSQPIAMWVGMAKPKGYSVMYCPMVKASWVQKDGETQNPYDETMRLCGNKV